MNLPGEIYAKQCESLADYYSEIVGHTFFAQYYPHVPAIRARYERKRIICYDNPAKGHTRLLADVLKGDEYEKKGLAQAFRDLAESHSRNIVLRNSDGGTKRFYLNQRRKLNGTSSVNLYRYFASRHEMIKVNGLEVPVNPYLISNVSYNISALTIAMCVPSHGNMHEHAMYTNGDVLHFENAGWNAVASDAATFIWHTLFGGNYFGPRYAEWAT
jgi:hypothetical protein